MPSFGGLDVFGSQVSMQTQDNPRAAQQNAFPGLSGVESLDQGLRGRVTTVTGRLSGVDAASLNAAEALFRSYHDGNAYSLVDTFGNEWSAVKLEEFAPQGRVQLLAPYGVYSRKYVAKFVHLL